MRQLHRYTLSTIAVLAVIANPVETSAQQSADLIRQGMAAYHDFNPQRALPLLIRGVNPNAGPRDSLWALGVQYVAQILYEQGNESAARTWARWAVRLAPDLRLDTVNVLTPVLAEFQRARAAGARETEESRVVTEWVWSATGAASGPGRIQLRQGRTPVPVSAIVEGRGAVGAGLSLPAGTYEIEARASGFHPLRVTREVLPGITTVLAFSLDGVAAQVAEGLRPDVRARVADRTTSLVATRFGQAESACGVGVLVGRDGLLLTTYSVIRGAERVTQGAEAPAGGPPRVAVYDVARDLAVLELPGARDDSLLVASELAENQPAWTFGSAACRLTEETRVSVGWADRGRALLRLQGSLGRTVQGTPVVTGDGRLLAIVRSDTIGLAAAAASDLLRRARENIASGAVRSFADVARAERHRYGSAIITGSLGAAAQLIPQDPWHWPELARSSALPLTFVGPEGRYRLTVRVGDQVRFDSVFTVIAGSAGRLAIPEPEPQPVALKKRKRWPWVVAALGGAGAAAALLAGGGGGDGGGNQSTTGAITVRFPNPP